LLFVISFSVFSVVACFCLPVARIQKSLCFFVLWCFSGKYIRAFVARRFKDSKIQSSGFSAGIQKSFVFFRALVF